MANTKKSIEISQEELDNYNKFRAEQGQEPLLPPEKKKIRNVYLSDTALEGLRQQAEHFGYITQNKPSLSAFIEDVGLKRFYMEKLL